MGDRSTPASTLESAIGSSDLNAPDIFTALGSQTRLAILIVLWEAYDPWAGDEKNSLSYSELRDKVGIKQGGEFNYHLNQLTGQLVQKSETGYAIHRAGLNLVQSIIAGLYRDEHYPETELDRECVFCGAPISITYQDGHLIQRCTQCEGNADRDMDGFLEGTIAATKFPPAGIENRSAEQLAAAGLYRQRLFATLKMGGVCPHCAGKVETSVDYCEDHTPTDDGFCNRCDSRYEIRVKTICSVCKSRWTGTTKPYAMLHPAAISFYHQRGLDVGFGVNDFDGLKRILELDVEQRLVSTDPVQVEVTLPYNGDEMTLVLDETMTVIEVNDPN